MRHSVNKKYIVYAVLGLVVILFVALSVRSCSTLIHKPEEGDEKASLYTGYEISEDKKLLVSGASYTDSTNPSKKGFTPYLRLDGVNVDNYYRQNYVIFGESSEEISGVLTYRGNALRNSATFGNAGIEDGIFSTTWKIKVEESIGLTEDLDCMGQPVIIKWDETRKQLLKLNESKKNKETLTEIIYASTDGKVYFLDLDNGSYSRNPLDLGCPVTGTGTICPDGTPLYVVGAGDCSEGDTSEIYVIDLVSGAVIYTFGERSNFSVKPPEEKYNFSAAAVFSQASDCLITQGENGVIYSYSVDAKMGSSELSATFSQKAEYTYTVNDGEGGTNTAQFSSSPAAWGSYVYTTDTEGHLVCTNVNDWNTVWMRDLGASCDATPCIEVDEAAGTAYIYIGTSLRLEDGKKTAGTVYIYKLNAANGDIIWRREYDARVTKKTNGGVVAAACLGENGLDDYVYFTIAGVGSKKSGMVVCLDKNDGGERYSIELKHYSVSDPVAAYGEDGTGYVIICDNRGNVFMLDGESGECLDTRELGERITTSPIVYEDTLILATEEQIYGIKLK
ncbi:MAG: PQQ-like beta-propeller repeat protein [Lachnospiraceae bacterium]|nr:PQQ-like beta-propeller repeat protein [Lachnospiraceae bacterium]